MIAADDLDAIDARLQEAIRVIHLIFIHMVQRRPPTYQNITGNIVPVDVKAVTTQLTKICPAPEPAARLKHDRS